MAAVLKLTQIFLTFHYNCEVALARTYTVYRNGKTRPLVMETIDSTYPRFSYFSLGNRMSSNTLEDIHTQIDEIENDQKEDTPQETKTTTEKKEPKETDDVTPKVQPKKIRKNKKKVVIEKN